MSNRIKIDISYITCTRNDFESGLTALIGVNAYAVLNCIKSFASYGSGICFPGMRKISNLTGISPSTVKRAIDVLIKHQHLIIVAKHGPKKGQTYKVRQMLTVLDTDGVLYTVHFDYIPANFQSRLKQIKQAVTTGHWPENLKENVDIVPGNKSILVEDNSEKSNKQTENKQQLETLSEFKGNLSGFLKQYNSRTN